MNFRTPLVDTPGFVTVAAPGGLSTEHVLDKLDVLSDIKNLPLIHTLLTVNLKAFDLCFGYAPNAKSLSVFGVGVELFWEK